MTENQQIRRVPCEVWKENVMKKLAEKWRDIMGYEGIYQVSNLGRARRIAMRHDTCQTKVPIERILKLKPMGGGYRGVCLCWKGQRKYISIHRLVASAFLENPNRLPEVNHLDGDKTKNSTDNLEWVTKSQNALHAHRTGLSGACRGEDHPNSKLTEDDVRVIRALPAFPHGPSTHTLAKQYNTSPTCIHDVLKRRTWKHIPGLSDGHWSRDCHG